MPSMGRGVGIFSGSTQWDGNKMAFVKAVGGGMDEKKFNI